MFLIMSHGCRHKDVLSESYFYACRLSRGTYTLRPVHSVIILDFVVQFLYHLHGHFR